MTMPLCYGYVFARGGSKGVPRKNVRLLDGKPLIAYSIDSLKQSRYVQRVIVSTEDEEIATVARENGAEIPFMRPQELAQDDSPELEAWRHALNRAESEGPLPDVFVSAPATAPFRQTADIDQAIELFLEKGEADLVITVAETGCNPYFNMVTVNPHGYAEIAMKAAESIYRRQMAPQVFTITPIVYVARPEYVRSCTSLLEGRVKVLPVPDERALDIDTALDFRFAEFLMQQER